MKELNAQQIEVINGGMTGLVNPPCREDQIQPDGTCNPFQSPPFDPNPGNPILF